jgi:hypothetical protein
MLEREALTKIRPKNLRDRRQLKRMSGYAFLVMVLLGTSLFLNHKHRQNIEASWQSATATIEDVRYQPATQVESNRGGAMLYNLQVLVKYDADSTTKKRWVTVQHDLVGLSEAKFAAFRWKGQKCIVRWKASDPDQVIADVS